MMEKKWIWVEELGIIRRKILDIVCDLFMEKGYWVVLIREIVKIVNII